jgi:hypothetical protein
MEHKQQTTPNEPVPSPCKEGKGSSAPAVSQFARALWLMYRVPFPAYAESSDTRRFRSNMYERPLCVDAPLPNYAVSIWLCMDAEESGGDARAGSDGGVVYEFADVFCTDGVYGRLVGMEKKEGRTHRR